nr:GH92 family glycosyl hydrolase [Pedobacter xinjiangensis]
MLTCWVVSSQAQKSVLQYVDPFIGTENSGNVFPGPSLPFGMVRLSPDGKMKKGKSPNNNSGYVSKSAVYGFSHTHVSGTGGGAKYGNILLMPGLGPADIKSHESEVSDEVAMPGYYSATLKKLESSKTLSQSFIKVELTTTHSVGLHRYTFPKSNQSHILIDAASFLVKGSSVQKLINSGIKILSDTEIEGFGTIAGGWNEGAPYTVYFHAVFNTPASSSQTWKNGVLSDEKEVKPATQKSKTACGAVFNYQTSAGQQIVAKVGISFISCAKARQNLALESGGKDFGQVKQEALETWTDLLQRIQIEDDNEANKKMFYTALYHVFLMPSNRTGENPLWQSDEPYYDDFYAIWDTYRASNPLITLLDQKRQEDIIRSLIDIYKHEGYMPDARSGNDNGLIQGGTNSDVLITDAYLKGLKNIDYSKAYEAMVKNAEVEPLRPKKEGREGIELYKSLGYVPYGISIAGSRTVEYAANDASIAMLAKGLGKTADAEKYLKRASNWQNIWRPLSNHGAKGFIWPKNKNGSWVDDFDFFRNGTFAGFLYEGNTWTYSLYVPQDVKKLMEFTGGKNAFVNRLDTFFVNQYYNVNNEPGFLMPCLYIWAGRQDRTAFVVNQTRNTRYSTGRGGLPGNDDSGAMSAWYAMHAMGFYPNAGQDVYLITAPLFKKVSVKLSTNKYLTIKSKNISKENIYIQSAKLNGKSWKKSWFRHADIINGATLEFVMGNKPSRWGSKNPPPSLSDKSN